MSNREEGLKAIQALDSKDFGGRDLKVNEAKPRPTLEAAADATAEDPAGNRLLVD